MDRSRNQRRVEEGTMNRWVNTSLMMLAGAGAGATLLYFLDPSRGGVRRARIHRRVASTLHDTRRVFGRMKPNPGRIEDGFDAGREPDGVPPIKDRIRQVRSNSHRWTSPPRLLTGTLATAALAYGIVKGRHRLTHKGAE